VKIPTRRSRNQDVTVSSAQAIAQRDC